MSDRQPGSQHSEYDFTLDPSTAPPRSFLEAASWRLTAELVRRYPDRFTVIETHPCDDTYDCITLVDRDAQSSISRIDMNRVGSVHVHSRDGSRWSWRGCWWELAAVDDLKQPLDRLLGHGGLISLDHLPKPTRTVVAYRVIAAFLTHQVLGPTRWTCLNGYLDNDGWSSGPRHEMFEVFPEARERSRTAAQGNLFEEIAYNRFWFLVKDSDPGLAIESAAGFAWDTKGRRTDLFARYRRTHSTWSALWSAAGHLLP